MIRDEREVILGCTDAEDAWRVYVDTPSRFARHLAALARAWGVTPRRCGAGVEVELPLRAVRFVKPPSARQVASARRAAAASQKARRAPETPVAQASAEGPQPQPDADPSRRVTLP